MPFKDPIKREEYRKSPQYKKSYTITGWKQIGLIGIYDDIYERYLNITHCELCNVFLEGRGPNKKCMEHDHETGQFRNVVCNSCNMRKSDRKKPNVNTSGYKNISYQKRNKYWVYKKTFKGDTIYKTSKNKRDILCYKFAGIILYNY